MELLPDFVLFRLCAMENYDGAWREFKICGGNLLLGLAIWFP